MKDATPEQHLGLLTTKSSVSERLQRVSAELLDTPYDDKTLIGSSTAPEKFVLTCTAFDCVTYCEYCVSIAKSSSVGDIQSNLKAMRYRDGEVSWLARNHYMYDWIQYNRQAGFLTDPFAGLHTLKTHKTLSRLPHYPARDAEMSFIPTDKIYEYKSSYNTGDIILFGSTSDDLDVYHMGFLIKGDDTLYLRHAARSARRVIEEPLNKFLNKNESCGVIIVRPV